MPVLQLVVLAVLFPYCGAQPPIPQLFPPPPQLFPHRVPPPPNGERACATCSWISTTRCKPGQADCIQPLIRYRRRQCSGTATIHCTAPNAEATLGIKRRGYWMRSLSIDYDTTAHIIALPCTQLHILHRRIMYRWIILLSCLLAALPESSGLPQKWQDAIDRKQEKAKQAAAALIDHIFSSIEQREEREAAAANELRELTKELQPYLEKKDTSEQAEQELAAISDALSGAKNQLEGSDSNVDQKQKEIDRIRDEINGIRYGLKERLQNIMSGKKPLVTETSKNSGFLNDITGASSWQTATWLLLAVCILLAIALIAALAYQASQKCKYDQLHGTNNK
ncbi:hypothetical protein GCK32_012320 [Trichostrongylus colubriformis]|uniref:Uncharacterized protein n=1 Tax=Trichostrongylus colubriformis TaxID=6319 RepID=A0AAN8ID07_TRICO